MARNFTTNDIITFPAPAAIQIDGGPITIVVVAKLNASAYHCPIYTKTSASAHGWSAEFDTAGGLHANYVTGTTNRNVGTVSTGAYFVSIFRKANSGTATPYGRFLTGTNFATDSGNINAPNTLADGSVLDSGSTVQLGRWGTVDYSNGIDIAAVAVWSSELADGTVTGFTTWNAITSASPSYWVKMDGSNVTDSASQTPSITGTTTATDPSGFFGAADQNVAVNGITSGAAVGNSTLSATYTINANGITSTERAGTPNVTPAVGANGVVSGERLGAATVSATYTINANGITSTERLGSTAAGLMVSASGISSAEKLGQPSISMTVNPSGVVTNAQVGSATVQPGAVTINANGIVSSEAIGAAVTILAQSINANGIVSSGQIGTPTITVGPVTINANGIVSSESSGSSRLDLTVSPSGITSTEKLGAPTITVTASGINASGVVSSEVVGSPTITASATVTAHGIRSAEQFGTSTLYSAIFSNGIASLEAVGSPTITVGAATINASGILSAAGLGSPLITALPLVPPTPDTLIRMRIGQTILSNDTGQTNMRMEDSESLIVI